MTARPWLAFLVLGLLNSAVANADEVRREGEKEVDTQFIFGFMAGADVGELGEKEFEHQTSKGSFRHILRQDRYRCILPIFACAEILR